VKTSLKATLIVTVGIAVIAFFLTIAAGWTPKLGLDLAGGFEATYKPDIAVSSGEMQTIISILQNRIDALGVSGATINSQGGNVVVQVPGLANRQQLLTTIQQTAEMLFRPVLCEAPPYAAPAKGKTPPSGTPTCGSQYLLTAANLNVSTSTGDPQTNIGPDPALAAYPTTAAPNNPVGDLASKTVLLDTAANAGFGGDRLLLGPAQVVGSQITSAQATFDSPDWVVNLNLSSSGSHDWDTLATQQFHAYIGIDLDAQVISAPLTLPNQATFTSFGGKVQISGNFSESTAKTLALDLQFGALPVTLGGGPHGVGPLSEESVSPTLGKSSLNAGLAAGIGGLILVLIYTIFYYRILGVVVLSGLAVTAALLWAIVSSLSHSGLDLTLDLSGVTGLIVSVGITVDSYIVYFERLKDEARAGRSVRSTVDRAFQGAFRTVLAADLVSLIAAITLYLLSVGDVRGFAFFLGLATLLDVFTTFFFTRPLVIWLGRNRRVTEARIIGIAQGLAMPAEAAT
jgi:preprotein translocase subunit SecD